MQGLQFKRPSQRIEVHQGKRITAVGHVVEHAQVFRRLRKRDGREGDDQQGEDIFSHNGKFCAAKIRFFIVVSLLPFVSI